ncbi:MAG: hypothetical protein Q9160_000034 [Pyrenula sp. 1 TL-2023]
MRAGLSVTYLSVSNEHVRNTLTLNIFPATPGTEFYKLLISSSQIKPNWLSCVWLHKTITKIPSPVTYTPLPKNLANFHYNATMPSSASPQKHRSTNSSSQNSYLAGENNTADLCAAFLNEISRPGSPNIDTSEIDRISEQSLRKLEIALGKYQEGTLTKGDKDIVKGVRRDVKETGNSKQEQR